jgi:hypothetical protein
MTKEKHKYGDTKMPIYCEKCECEVDELCEHYHKVKGKMEIW